MLFENLADKVILMTLMLDTNYAQLERGHSFTKSYGCAASRLLKHSRLQARSRCNSMLHLPKPRLSIRKLCHNGSRIRNVLLETKDLEFYQIETKENLNRWCLVTKTTKDFFRIKFTFKWAQKFKSDAK